MRIDLTQLDFIEDILKEIALYVEAEYGLDTITSLYRIGDSGVHGQLPLRGMDLRCRDATLGEQVENLVNEMYVYDPSRPAMKVCMFHDVGQGAHVHLQCHPNTKLR